MINKEEINNDFDLAEMIINNQKGIDVVKINDETFIYSLLNGKFGFAADVIDKIKCILLSSNGILKDIFNGVNVNDTQISMNKLDSKLLAEQLADDCSIDSFGKQIIDRYFNSIKNKDNCYELINAAIDGNIYAINFLYAISCNSNYYMLIKTELSDKLNNDLSNYIELFLSCNKNKFKAKIDLDDLFCKLTSPIKDDSTRDKLINKLDELNLNEHDYRLSKILICKLREINEDRMDLHYKYDYLQ